MGGHGTSNQRQLQNTNTTTTENVTGIQPYQQQFGQDYNTLGATFANRISQPINLQSAPLYSSQLDPIVASQLSSGIQGILGRNASNMAATSSQLTQPGTGDNSALLSALNSMGKFSTAGATNALIPQALEAQRGYDLQRQQMLNALNSQTLAARAQSINELSPGMNLLGLLNGMAGVSAGRVQNTTGTSGIHGSTTSSKSFL